MSDVDMFGLDEFGTLPEGALAPIYGAAIGGVVSSGAALLAQRSTLGASLVPHAEGIGTLAGSLAGGAMMFFPKTRGAGATAIAAAISTAGIRYLANMLLKSDATSTAASSPSSAAAPSPSSAPSASSAVVGPDALKAMAAQFQIPATSTTDPAAADTATAAETGAEALTKFAQSFHTGGFANPSLLGGAFGATHFGH